MSKGSEWERKVCKFISKGIQGTEKPYAVGRTHGSGSVHTQNESVGENFAGDIHAIKEEGKILTDIGSIECKTGYENTSIDKHLKYNKSDPLKNSGEQCINDATKTDRYPMLIFKKKGNNPGVGIDVTSWINLIDDLEYLRFVFLRGEADIEKEERVLSDIYLFDFYEFFDNLQISTVKNFYNKVIKEI